MTEEEVYAEDENQDYIGHEEDGGEEEEWKSPSPVLIFDEEEPEINPKSLELIDIISKFTLFVPDIPVTRQMNDAIIFSIPSSFVPVTLRVAYGYIDSDTLLDVRIELDDYNWTKMPNAISITNPVNHNYCGKALVEKAKDNFFSSKYKPKQKYRCAPMFVRAQTDTDSKILKQVEDAGYSHTQAIRAVSLCNNDYDKSVTFLQTGQYQLNRPFSLPVTYIQCPLLYFVLEIFDAILDLQDHCAMCGEPITPGLRANVCDKDICLHRFIHLGVGMSLVKEIKRDPFVADFLFSIFACAHNTKFFDPKPKIEIIKGFGTIIEKMPKMKKLGEKVDDTDLYQSIGKDSANILRWVILTCRSNFLLLPRELEFPQFRSTNKDLRCFQFMALTASPEQENIFQQLKKKYGSRFLWHGSATDRWHSIIRQGLKNLSNTSYMACGAAHGEGIYFAPDSGTSLGYSRTFKNLYGNSALGENFYIIALCEVIKLPLNKDIEFTANLDEEGSKSGRKKVVKGFLKDHGWCFTLTMNEASIVRFVFVNLDQHVNVAVNPPRNIPTLNQVLKLRAHI